MKKMLLMAILFCLGSMAFAQKVYFIYIQSEAGAPFYVKMGEKVYSSTASGYVILPELKDSTYSLFLGQPGNQAKELRFSISIDNSDHGYLLKSLQDGWVLFDLQSMGLIKPTVSTSGLMYDSNSVKSDHFTRLLSKAVDDSTLLMEPVIARREDPKSSKKEESKKTPSKEKSDAVVNASEKNPVNENVALNTIVSEAVPVTTHPTSDSNAVKEVTSDANPLKDTIVRTDALASKPIVAPRETNVPQETSVPKDTANANGSVPFKDTSTIKEVVTLKETNPQDASVPATASVQNEPKAGSNPAEKEAPEQTEFKHSIVKKYAESSNFQGFGLTFIDTWEGVTDTIRLVIPNIVDASALVRTEQPKVDSQPSIQKADSQVAIPEIPHNHQTSAPVAANEKESVKATVVSDSASLSSCKEVASNKDFLDLRKEMASKDRGEEMLAEARKAFSEKCYTTEQIRKLSVLFYTQEGKFLFFKEAKPFVSDKDRFNTLMFELNEDAYQDRFKSLLEN